MPHVQVQLAQSTLRKVCFKNVEDFVPWQVYNRHLLPSKIKEIGKEHRDLKYLSVGDAFFSVRLPADRNLLQMAWKVYESLQVPNQVAKSLRTCLLTQIYTACRIST